MAHGHNTRLLSHIECKGGGPVWFDRNILYVSHMRPPRGTPNLTRPQPGIDILNATL